MRKTYRVPTLTTVLRAFLRPVLTTVISDRRGLECWTAAHEPRYSNHIDFCASALLHIKQFLPTGSLPSTAAVLLAFPSLMAWWLYEDSQGPMCAVDEL
jgi:hypothetical protein